MVAKLDYWFHSSNQIFYAGFTKWHLQANNLQRSSTDNWRQNSKLIFDGCYVRMAFQIIVLKRHQQELLEPHFKREMLYIDTKDSMHIKSWN